MMNQTPTSMTTGVPSLLRRRSWRVGAAAALVMAGFAAGALERQPPPGPDPLLNLAFSAGNVFDVP